MVKTAGTDGDNWHKSNSDTYSGGSGAATGYGSIDLVFKTTVAPPVSVTDNITVTFSEAMEPSYITTTTSDTTCRAETIKVSSDNFSTCVRMSSEPVSSNTNKTFTLDPYDNLTVGTTYLTRVTTGVKDTAGNAMSSQYDNSTGFTPADFTPPTVSSVSTTADNQSAISLTDNITVTFSEAMDNTTVTANTDNTSCYGTIGVSSDNFSSCLQMSSAPASSDNITFTLDPSDNLTAGATYKTRVTTAAKDTAGNALSSQYDNSTGFTTLPAAVPVSVYLSFRSTVSYVSSNVPTGVAINDTVTFSVTVNPALGTNVDCEDTGMGELSQESCVKWTLVDTNYTITFSGGHEQTGLVDSIYINNNGINTVSCEEYDMCDFMPEGSVETGKDNIKFMKGNKKLFDVDELTNGIYKTGTVSRTFSEAIVGVDTFGGFYRTMWWNEVDNFLNPSWRTYNYDYMKSPNRTQVTLEFP